MARTEKLYQHLPQESSMLRLSACNSDEIVLASVVTSEQPITPRRLRDSAMTWLKSAHSKSLGKKRINLDGKSRFRKV